MEGVSINLSSKLSLTCGGNVAHYISVYHPLPYLSVGIENTLAVLQTNNKLFFEMSVHIFFFLAKKGRGRSFSERTRRELVL